ncbi:MAG: DNA methyltransferase [Actinomycetota bacterium]|nr:site-specific DNA-methyltransferase [Actinomycetota bacterium]
MSPKPRKTSTSSFGVSRRETHDSSDFYARFPAPSISSDNEINQAAVVDRIYAHDARDMSEIPDNSVALVITSPPYFAGKDYEKVLGEGQVPASYIEYLSMLRDVFSECVRKLEPGGRMAINVANLGRKPYRSLSSDVTSILQDDLGLLLRGEVIWLKADGASGSCAWGSFQNSANPVLRDLTERVIIASKGRFDRALTRRERAERGLPSEVSIFRDDFMAATTDVWEIPPESANRVGHPAPFPVELPLRLIHLYTYREDLVLDPFIGSGSAAVAALRSERHYVGYDSDPKYVQAAQKRLEEEKKRIEKRAKGQSAEPKVVLPAIPQMLEDGEPFQARAVREGRQARDIARAVIHDCGFNDIAEDHRFRNGVEVNFIAKDALGQTWYFDVSGAFSSTRAGLRRTDTIWKALGKAALMSEYDAGSRLILLTTDLPPMRSAGYVALRSARGRFFVDALEMLSLPGQKRLRKYALGTTEPIGELLGPQED